MAGSWYGHEGAAIDSLCIPKTLSQQFLNLTVVVKII